MPSCVAQVNNCSRAHTVLVSEIVLSYASTTVTSVFQAPTGVTLLFEGRGSHSELAPDGKPSALLLPKKSVR